MAVFFLIIVFTAYISLGLPDSGAGVAWPFIRAEFNVPLAYAGLISIITTSCACISSLLTAKLVKRIGTGLINAFSCTVTGAAILACSFAPGFWILAVLAIPLGFGAGAVDSSINGYVAEHYGSKIMNFLHASWGLGAMVSPLLITLLIHKSGSWRTGYFTVGIVQLSLSVIFFLTLKLWKKDFTDNIAAEELHHCANLPATFKKLPVWLAVLTFFFYCGAEQSMGLWLGSLLVNGRGYSPVLMGTVVSVYYGAIMIGRVAFGFISKKIGNKLSVRVGLSIAVTGITLILIRTLFTSILGVMLFGFGLAPIYPCSMHETPRKFNPEVSRKIISYQMAFAYVSMLSFSPLVGLISSKTSLEAMPFTVAALIGVLIIITEILNYLAKKNSSKA